MKRVLKSSTSEIITGNLKYKSNSNNSKIAEILLKEQKGFCAYTEEYIGYDDASDIEHFNPNLKDKPEDNYYNWYKVKHLPNQRKSNTWIENIIMPYNEDFENRILYLDGIYYAKLEDQQANNLIILLDLNNPKRVENRKRYIKRRKERIEERQITTKEGISLYFQNKIENEINSIKYLRAIQEEFNIEIWEMIP